MKTRHTLTITYTREPQTGPGIPRGEVDHDVQDIEIDGTDIADFIKGYDYAHAVAIVNKLLAHLETK